MSERYDIAIIGSGAAGLSASLIAKIRNKSFIIFGDKDLTGHLKKAPRIENYLGFPPGSGRELLGHFRDHIEAMDINITEERISNVFKMDDYFEVLGMDNTYEAKSVIVATGVEYTAPIKGEEEFVGKGVGYCTTCDGPLYKGKTVVVVSYLKEGEAEANFINEIAKNVYYVPLYEEEYNLDQGIKIIKDNPLEITGDKRVNKLILKNSSIETDGVFVLKNAIPMAELVPGLEVLNGHIKADINMKTSLEGCFAAGDCVGLPYQDIKAAGQGNVAALSAINYLNSKNE